MAVVCSWKVTWLVVCLKREPGGTLGHQECHSVSDNKQKINASSTRSETGIIVGLVNLVSTYVGSFTWCFVIGYAMYSDFAILEGQICFT